MTYARDRIKQIVFMENVLRNIANVERKRAHDSLKVLLGKSIYKKGTSSLFEKFKGLYVPLDYKDSDFISCNIWLSCNEYSVYVNIKVCFKDPQREGCIYWEKNSYILDIREGLVLKVYDLIPDEMPLIFDDELNQYLRTEEAHKSYSAERDKMFYAIRSEFFKN